MNYGELRDHLKDRILRRPDLAADPKLLLLAINAGQTQLMMDGDFRCMETHKAIVYPSTTGVYGVAMPQAYAAGPPAIRACKRISGVWTTTGATSADGVAITGTPVPTLPITPATESSENSKRLILAQTTAAAPNRSKQKQTWYEKETNLVLLTAPAVNAVLMVDYYGFLKPYALDADTDYFTSNLYMCLMFAAAWVGSISMWEDTRQDYFEKGYRTYLSQAIASDGRFKVGGIPAKPPAELVPAEPATAGQPPM